MPDQQPSQQRRSDAGTQTTATSLTAAGFAAFLLWFFGMIDAGHFFVPPVETAMFMGAALLPIGQAIGKRWIREINHGGEGKNGKSPSKPDETEFSASSAGQPAG